MKLVFNTNGNDKQKEVAKCWIDNSIIDILYGGSKGSGKSYLGVNLIFGDAFLYPQSHYFIARKDLNNIRKFTIPTVYEVFEHWGISSDYYKFNGQDNYFTLYNGSKIFLMDAKYLPSDPEYYRFGSMQNTRGWIEEAGEFEEAAKNNLAASVGRWKNDIYNINGKILQTCNPSKNYLYRNYYKKHKAGTLEDYRRYIQALPTDNKKLPEGYLENLMRTLDKNQRERLLFGNWEYDDDPTVLCEYDNIIAIFNNDHVRTGNKYIVADIARFGSDKAIVTVWDGMILTEYYIFDKSKITDIQDCINSLRYKHSIPKHHCIADEDGVGGGVVDNCGILGFVNNSRPLENPDNGEPENYYNLQSQMGYLLAYRINNNDIYIKADMPDSIKEAIIEELEQLKSYEMDNDKKLRIMPKELVKQNIGRSPDWRDVLLMRMYFEKDSGYGGYAFGSTKH